MDTLKARAAAEPFNVAASVIFLLAILHTFAAASFTKLSHKYEHEHERNSGNPVSGDSLHPGRSSGSLLQGHPVPFPRRGGGGLRPVGARLGRRRHLLPFLGGLRALRRQGPGLHRTDLRGGHHGHRRQPAGAAVCGSDDVESRRPRQRHARPHGGSAS